MSRCQIFVAVVSGLAVAAMGAESPQDATRKAMQVSVARQMQAVAAMQMSIAKQRAAVHAAPVAHDSGGITSPYFVLSWPALGPSCDQLPEENLAPLIEQTAKKEGVDASLLRLVAEQESGFRPCAVSPKGAMGLMQLMPATAREMGVQDPFDPQENLQTGARFLKQLLAQFGGNTALALSAYNAGPERVEEAGGVPAIPETIRYVEHILSRLPMP